MNYIYVQVILNKFKFIKIGNFFQYIFYNIIFFNHFSIIFYDIIMNTTK